MEEKRCKGNRLRIESLLTPDFLVESLKVTKGTLDSWRRRFGLPFVRLGGKVFYLEVASWSGWTAGESNWGVQDLTTSERCGQENTLHDKEDTSPDGGAWETPSMGLAERFHANETLSPAL